MGSKLDVFSNIMVNPGLARPEPAKVKEFEQGRGVGEDDDVREWVSRGVIIPRDSMPPPPVPRKDTRPNTRIYELPGDQGEDWMSIVSEKMDDKETEESQQLQFVLSNMLESQNSASGEIKIHFTPPLPASRSAEKTLSDTMTTVHPLAMSPPSPLDSLPRVPQRPARPSSLRLSSFARKKELTTSRVLVLNMDKPETTNPYQTQPHTGYNGSSRTKYGRGKHAATELIPQPSDDPQDPLVSTGMTRGVISSHD